LLNQIRNRAIYKAGDSYLTYKSWVIYSSLNALALRKGLDGAAVITVLNNMGANGGTNTFTLTSTGYSQGAVIYDVLSCTTTTAGSGGSVYVSIQQGLPKVCTFSSGGLRDRVDDRKIGVLSTIDAVRVRNLRVIRGRGRCIPKNGSMGGRGIKCYFDHFVMRPKSSDML
jgi:Domain of unknown function (DUF1966)